MLDTGVAGLLRTIVRRSDFLVVVPPWGDSRRASLGPHLLQAVAKARGYDVQVLYANVLFERVISQPVYDRFIDASEDLLGERMFARAAHDLPALGRNGHEYAARPFPSGRTAGELEETAVCFVEALALAIAESGTPIVGCSTSYEQTNAALAILRALKRIRPGVITLLGGANCEGPMGDALYELAAPYVDAVFSGEAEEQLIPVLDLAARDGVIAGGVVRCAPLQQLDELPTPDFRDFLEQVELVLPAAAKAAVRIPYESSRGCWWGAKHHCTFCGLNGEGMGFRQKSAGTVFADLHGIAAATGVRSIEMADNIMPHAYLKSLVPLLRDSPVPGVELFYEIKANLSFRDVLELKDAGITRIQPGIESLSTPLLRLMRKGVTAGQNIALLRYARACGMAVDWNLLLKFPGDRLEWYEETLAVMPLLVHLQPPSAAYDVVIERFSPYFNGPESFGIENVRPLPAYADVLPPGHAPERLAYHFQGEMKSALDEAPEWNERLRRAGEAWRTRWRQSPLPVFHLFMLDRQRFVLHDTRELGGPAFTALTYEEAAALVTPCPLPAANAFQRDALARGYAVALDGGYVPLATVEVETAIALGLIVPSRQAEAPAVLPIEASA
jgi:ribosomal peptide maturation radical SAM protein 1